MANTNIQRSGATGGLAFAVSGIFELLFQLSPTLPIIIGLAVFILFLFVRLPASIEAELERQFDALPKAWALFIISVACSTVVFLLLIDLMSSGGDTGSQGVRAAENGSGDRHLQDEARRQFIQSLHSGKQPEGKVFLVEQEFCNECSDFLEDIGDALNQTKIESEPWFSGDGEKGPPDGITVNGPRQCDEVDAIQTRLTEAFEAAGFNAICKVDPESSGDAWIYVSKTYK